MRSTTYDPAGTVSDGIAAYELAVSRGHGADSSGRYRRLAGQVRSVMQPGDTCVLAFAAELDRPDGARGSAPAFVAVLDDRVLVAWRRGRLRPRAGTVVVSRRSVDAIRESGDATDPERLSLTAGAEHEFLLTAPVGTRSALHDVLRRALPGTPAPKGR